MYFNTHTTMINIASTQLILSYFSVFGLGMFIAAVWSDLWKPSSPGILGLVITLASALVYLVTRLG